MERENVISRPRLRPVSGKKYSLHLKTNRNYKKYHSPLSPNWERSKGLQLKILSIWKMKTMDKARVMIVHVFLARMLTESDWVACCLSSVRVSEYWACSCLQQLTAYQISLSLVNAVSQYGFGSLDLMYKTWPSGGHPSSHMPASLCPSLYHISTTHFYGKQQIHGPNVILGGGAKILIGGLINDKAWGTTGLWVRPQNPG